MSRNRSDVDPDGGKGHRYSYLIESINNIWPWKEKFCWEKNFLEAGGGSPGYVSSTGNDVVAGLEDKDNVYNTRG